MNSDNGLDLSPLLHVPLWYGLVAALVAWWVYRLMSHWFGESLDDKEDRELKQLCDRYQEIHEAKRVRRERFQKEWDQTKQD